MSPASPHRRTAGRRRLALFAEYAKAQTGPGSGTGGGPNRNSPRAAGAATTRTVRSYLAGTDGWNATR
ncbi:hypothetical protein GCM10010347_41380 [Streptomyces cirratus]|uniref:Uncharacterized protein n=1 Tax=Streptomyces cirratus TaxID=68187 RepID=A0ABQ3F0K1_9ACTN|nr:hypothetical protein [Streptomyces cirratus]GHB67027.1 hypothetical protein GCM10010347_41380 [Streptomyces cirratus]